MGEIKGFFENGKIIPSVTIKEMEVFARIGNNPVILDAVFAKAIQEIKNKSITVEDRKAFYNIIVILAGNLNIPKRVADFIWENIKRKPEADFHIVISFIRNQVLSEEMKTTFFNFIITKSINLMYLVAFIFNENTVLPDDMFKNKLCEYYQKIATMKMINPIRMREYRNVILNSELYILNNIHNPRINKDIIKILAQHSSNPEILHKIWQLGMTNEMITSDVLSTIAGNKYVSSETLREMFEDRCMNKANSKVDSSVIGKILENNNASEDLLLSIIDKRNEIEELRIDVELDEEIYSFCLIAEFQNITPRLGEAILGLLHDERTCADAKAELIIGLFKNPRADSKLILDIWNEYHKEYRIGKRKKTDKFKKLFSSTSYRLDDDNDIYELLLGNPNTPKEIMLYIYNKKLPKDKELKRDYLLSIVDNPNISPFLLEKALEYFLNEKEDASYFVMYDNAFEIFAIREKISSEALHQIWLKRNELCQITSKVLAFIAGNRNTDIATLEDMIDNIEDKKITPQVLAEIVENPKINENLLIKLWNKKYGNEGEKFTKEVFKSFCSLRAVPYSIAFQLLRDESIMHNCLNPSSAFFRPEYYMFLTSNFFAGRASLRHVTDTNDENLIKFLTENCQNIRRSLINPEERKFFLEVLKRVIKSGEDKEKIYCDLAKIDEELSCSKVSKTSVEILIKLFPNLLKNPGYFCSEKDVFSEVSQRQKPHFIRRFVDQITASSSGNIVEEGEVLPEKIEASSQSDQMVSMIDDSDSPAPEKRSLQEDDSDCPDKKRRRFDTFVSKKRSSPEEDSEIPDGKKARLDENGGHSI
ncbi:MAG: hypothetical protein PHY80_02015 [Rickettsiales bacterium]|nr:hypothetical protein [Rickettsiales bacterium]